jgi:mitochondrial import inner membrane translocase subunit TIM10
MSWFGGSSEPQGPTELEIAKTQTDAQIDFFRRMATMCAKKCIVKHTEAELSVGEMSCIDRCSSKYMQAREIVTEVQTQAEQKMQAMAQQGVAPPPKFK